MPVDLFTKTKLTESYGVETLNDTRILVILDILDVCPVMMRVTYAKEKRFYRHIFKCIVCPWYHVHGKRNTIQLEPLVQERANSKQLTVLS